ncbi:MAG: HpcH/HpaI aldolase/citrate lyase family protein [Sedimentibacter sp.]
MNNDRIKSFKEKLKNSYTFGPFSKTSDPTFIEILGHAQFDFVILDLEHGPNSVETLQNLIRAAQVSDILPIVRVKENNLSIIGEVLDIGAAGIQIPKVENADQARMLISQAKFAPSGNRGVCRFVRAAEYSAQDRFEYFRDADNIVVILQIEGQQAISQLDEILKVDGIDLIFIGPYDLSQSIGIPGQIDHPLVTEKMMEIIDLCNKHNIVVGTFVDNMENAARWKKAGIKYLAYSVDTGIFYEASRDLSDKLKVIE